MAGASYNVLHDHALTATANGSNGTYGTLQNVTTDTSNALSITSVNGNASGIGNSVTLMGGSSLTLNADGSFNFTPVAHSAYFDSCSVVISDGVSTASMSVNFSITNNAPTLSLTGNYSYSLSHDHAVQDIDVLADASDADGDTLQVVVTSNPSHGTFVQNNSGKWDYTPNAGWTGYDWLGVKVNDGAADSSVVSYSFTVSNAAPTVQGQSLPIIHDQVLTNVNPLAGATDADGDTLTPIIVTGPSHGSFIANGDGTYNYYADAGWTGTDTISINASDGLASAMMPATISIAVTNTTPVASNTSLSTEHGMPLTTINLFQYLADADDDPLEISIVSGPSNGTFAQNDDGSWTYTPMTEYEGPNPDFIGTDSITFKANDGVANSNTATLTFNVTLYAPTNNNTYSLLHDHVLPNINFAQNDTDAAGDPSAVVIVSDPSHSTLFQNTDGTWNLTPDAHYYGTDSVTISANGGSNVVVTINITDIAPVVRDTALPLEAFDGTYTGMALVENAADGDHDTLSIDFLTQPQHGTVSFDSDTGLYDYTATANYLGRDNFSFRYYDGARYSETVIADILVYDDTTDFATDSYVEGFAGLSGAAFNGAPSGMGLKQGNINDCWFIAAESGLAQARPADLSWDAVLQSGLIQENNNGTFTVRFPGRNAVNNLAFDRGPYVHVLAPAGGFRFSTSEPNNGDWSAILEQAWATRFQPANGTLGTGIQFGLNLANVGSGGIRYLTGHGVDIDNLSITAENATAAKLAAALNPANAANKRVVTAMNLVSGFGLVGPHVYTVTAYNANAQTVTVRNPWGLNNPANYSYNNAALQRALRLPALVRPVPLAAAKLQAGNDARGAVIPGQLMRSADFTMSLTEFVNVFSSVNYEEAN